MTAEPKKKISPEEFIRRLDEEESTANGHHREVAAHVQSESDAYQRSIITNYTTEALVDGIERGKPEDSSTRLMREELASRTGESNQL